MRLPTLILAPGRILELHHCAAASQYGPVAVYRCSLTRLLVRLRLINALPSEWDGRIVAVRTPAFTNVWDGGGRARRFHQRFSSLPRGLRRACLRSKASPTLRPIGSTDRLVNCGRENRHSLIELGFLDDERRQ